MFLLTYYVTDVIVITIIMALVIRSTREQLALFQIIKNGFIFQNKKPLFVLLQQFCSKEFSVFMVSGCYHLLRTRASCRHVLVYHMCDLGLQSM